MNLHFIGTIFRYERLFGLNTYCGHLNFSIDRFNMSNGPSINFIFLIAACAAYIDIRLTQVKKKKNLSILLDHFSLQPLLSNNKIIVDILSFKKVSYLFSFFFSSSFQYRRTLRPVSKIYSIVATWWM